MITFYDAFAGIGGFRLGLERTGGFKCVGACEIDDYARRVYHKNFGDWPDGDVREVTDINGADMLCGGFPCQPFSSAAHGRNVDVPLWDEMFRLVGTDRPRWVLGENVPGISSFSDVVLSDLDGASYETAVFDLPASLFGAPQEGFRRWFVAKANGDGEPEQPVDEETPWCQDISAYVSWPDPPANIRMDDGVPRRMDRLRCLGNAVVPQVVEWIGRRILEVRGMKGEE